MYASVWRACSRQQVKRWWCADHRASVEQKFCNFHFFVRVMSHEK